ncbi:hypothetical protein HAX54_023953 [Datura stramonium]|uniref:XS domain-containing protein n=1 Tax=Datura stramonium TaxID=4076 RepID=A0ABS8S5M4_DATST|nr:hypothetical protein [Datura stramonium]
MDKCRSMNTSKAAVDRPINGAEEPSTREKLNAKSRVVSEPPPTSTKDALPLLASSKTKDDPIVFPWMGIVANIPVEYKEGHTRYAIVEFKGDWSRFMNAMTFGKAFELDKHGKRDWNLERCRDDKLYAWIACHEDYYSQSLIGNYLRKNGDLKSVIQIQVEKKGEIHGCYAT